MQFHSELRWSVAHEGAVDVNVIPASLLVSQIQANTDPSQHDAPGRRHYVNLTYRS
jgi:hypothetical protein